MAWQELMILIGASVVAATVYAAWRVAEGKGRNREMWAVRTFFVLPALLVLLVLPSTEQVRSR